MFVLHKFRFFFAAALALRRFFVGGTRSDDGEDVAWDKIRIKLQEIVDNEDKKKPLSENRLQSQKNVGPSKLDNFNGQASSSEKIARAIFWKNVP